MLLSPWPLPLLRQWRPGPREPHSAPPRAPPCPQAKRVATETGWRVVDAALQLHGGYGYLRDLPLERFLRDVRVHRILEGTNEIMNVLISRAVLQQ